VSNSSLLLITFSLIKLILFTLSLTNVNSYLKIKLTSEIVALRFYSSGLFSLYSLKSITMFPFYISKIVPGLPIIEIGCFINIPYRLRCICAGNMIFEYGFAFIIAYYIRADNSTICPIVFCGDYCSILFSSFEKSMTSPYSDLSLSGLSAIINSSFMSVLSVSIEIS